MMRRHIASAMLALSLASVNALAAGERVNETKDAASDGFVRIMVVRGSLEIEGWDRDAIQVTGRLDEQMEEFIFEVRPGDAIIEVKLPRNMNSWCCEDGSDLEIRVPRGSNVDVSVVSTDVTVEDIQGGLDISGVSGDMRATNVHERVDIMSVSGEIDVRDATGRIELKSVSGDVDGTNLKGDLHLHSVSGDILAREVENELDLESVSGNVEVIAGKMTVARGHTVSGDVDVSGDLHESGRFEFDSVSGSVRLRINGDVNARFDLETGSGSIRNRITSDKPKTSKYSRDESLRFVAGNGKGDVVIETRSGDIVVSRD